MPVQDLHFSHTSHAESVCFACEPAVVFVQVPGKRAEGQAAQHHEQQKGYPQSMVAQTLQRPGKWQQQNYRQQHAVAHFTGTGGADKQSVEQVTPDRNQRQRGKVGQVNECGVAHALNVGLHLDKQMPGEQEQHGKAQARQQ